MLTQAHIYTDTIEYTLLAVRKMSFVTIGLSQLFSWAGDYSSDFGHSWHVSQKSNMFNESTLLTDCSQSACVVPHNEYLRCAENC